MRLRPRLRPFEKTKLLSKFFAGSSQIGGAAETSALKLSLSKLEGPAAGQPQVATERKNKEGC